MENYLLKISIKEVLTNMLDHHLYTNLFMMQVILSYTEQSILYVKLASTIY